METTFEPAFATPLFVATTRPSMPTMLTLTLAPASSEAASNPTFKTFDVWFTRKPESQFFAIFAVTAPFETRTDTFFALDES